MIGSKEGRPRKLKVFYKREAGKRDWLGKSVPGKPYRVLLCYRMALNHFKNFVAPSTSIPYPFLYN